MPSAWPKSIIGSHHFAPKTSSLVIRMAERERTKPPKPPEDAAALSQANASIETSRVGSTPDVTPETPVIKQFGRYRIEQELGKGAMGVVYLAEDTQLGRKVALKIPKRSSLKDAVSLERFYREARTTSQLRHNNICPVFDVGDIDGVHYLTMAYIRGKPLNSFVNKDKPPAARQVALLIRKIALALEEAHQHGIVHRDLKPSNVMLDDRGEPIVMDFGLAHDINTAENARLTQAGAILGTPAYMAPEQVRGELGQIGPACDIYALGVMLYQFLTGKLPFGGPIMMVFAQIVTQPPVKPSELRTDVDPALEAICLKMMAKSIGDRYASMEDVAAALTGFLKAGTAARLKPTSTVVVSASTVDPDSPFENPATLRDSDVAKSVPRSPSPIALVGIAKQLPRRIWLMIAGVSAVLLLLGGYAMSLIQWGTAGTTPLKIDANARTVPDGITTQPVPVQTPVEDKPAVPVFPVGAIYRGIWKNFSAGQSKSDAETELVVTVTERDGAKWTSEWFMEVRGVTWRIKGTVIERDGGGWKVTSEDLDLIGTDHPNEGNTHLVADVDQDQITIRGKALYTSGARSEFEMMLSNPDLLKPGTSEPGGTPKQNEFPLGANYSGTWNGYAPGSTVITTTRAFQWTTTKRDGVNVEAACVIENPLERWKLTGQINSREGKAPSLVIQDNDLLDADHPLEGKVTLVVELSMDGMTLVGKGFSTTGIRSEFEGTLNNAEEMVETR